MASARVFRRFEGTISTSGAATADAALTLSSSSREDLWLLHSVYIHPTTVGAPAATYDIRLSEASGWTNGDHEERYANTSNDVADRVQDIFATSIPVKADSSGLIHLRVTFNAGTTHTVTYSVDFEHVTGN